MKRVVVAVLGFVLLLTGLALLVLPGPGFVCIFAGLFLLSTQFDWAKHYADAAKIKAAQGIEEVRRSRWRTAFAAVSAVALLAVGILELTPLDLPWVTGMSAVLLIFSGVGLVATLIYARHSRPRSLLAQRSSGGPSRRS